MTLIDEKGRLFGKINIIDFLLILFLFVIIPISWSAYKILKKPQAVILKPKEYIEVEMSCSFIKLTPKIAKLIRGGDKELDANGEIVGEITWLGETKPYCYKFLMSTDARDPILLKENLNLLELPVKLRLKMEVRNQNWLYYQDQQVLYNSSFDFKTMKYTVQVVPIMPIKERKEQWMQVRVKFAGISPELSNLINKGHIEKDENGRIIGKLKEIVVSKPSEIQALKLEDNRVVLINDPYRTDVVALLDLLCTNSGGDLYFKNYPVKIGSQITFSSNLYIVSGIITAVYPQINP